MSLDALRNQIDTIDQQLVDLLNRRVRLAAEIGHIKLASGQDIYVPSREEAVFRKVSQLSKGPLGEAEIRAIYRQIISCSIAQEKQLQIAYLGPEATFTHQAARKNFGECASYRPAGHINDVFDQVERGEADFGVIPIENSTEGAVFHSMDMLVETELKIVAQVYLPIEHCLITPCELSQVERVLSKDNALGQCRNWLTRYLPHAVQVACDSTSKAVLCARGESGTAAVASRLAAELYDVPIRAERIQDRIDNVTRFLVIGKCRNAPPPSAEDRSSYVFSLHDEPGSLHKALNAFSSRGLNLSKIESRPSRQKLWSYFFFVDVNAHCDEPCVSEAVDELVRLCPFVKWLGSYPNTRLV